MDKKDNIVTIKIDRLTRMALRYIAAVTGKQQQHVADALIQAEAKRLGWSVQTLSADASDDTSKE